MLDRMLHQILARMHGGCGGRAVGAAHRHRRPVRRILLMGRTHLVGDEARLVMAKGISHNRDLLIPFGTIQTARGLRASLCGLPLD
jgi:hypothetical protein